MDVTRDNNQSGVWRTRVTDLLLIFREALQVLAPVVKKAGINYEDDLAYDDWDNIAQSLYTNIVERSVRSAAGLDEDLTLPSYAMLYERYEQNALILVLHPRHASAEPVVFHSFASRQGSFDTVVGVVLTGNRRTEGVPLWEAPAAGARFGLLLRYSGEPPMEEIGVLI
jgi:hypothetical protein